MLPAVTNKWFSLYLNIFDTTVKLNTTAWISFTLKQILGYLYKTTETVITDNRIDPLTWSFSDSVWWESGLRDYTLISLKVLYYNTALSEQYYFHPYLVQKRDPLIILSSAIAKVPIPSCTLSYNLMGSADTFS